MILMLIVKKLGVLRVSEAGELEGLDIHEHGVPAYPEYGFSDPAWRNSACCDDGKRAISEGRPGDRRRLRRA